MIIKQFKVKISPERGKTRRKKKKKELIEWINKKDRKVLSFNVHSLFVCKQYTIRCTEYLIFVSICVSFRYIGAPELCDFFPLEPEFFTKKKMRKLIE